MSPKHSIAAGVILIALKISQWILQWPRVDPSSAYFWDGLQFALAARLIYSGLKQAKQ
jgi:hypothetical protein